MKKLFLYQVEIVNTISMYRWYMTFACASDDPATALKTILDSGPFREQLRSGRPDEPKRLAQFNGPNGSVFVEDLIG
jgi:hypothetical protein